MDLFGMFGADKRTMVDPQRALPGRDTAQAAPTRHAVLGQAPDGPWDAQVAVLYVAMGCFWGAEEYYWQAPGVVSTAVGYQGGFTANPSYEEVCTGRTGHTESVLVAYDTTVTSTLEMLRIFWEHHDPTQGYRQGNDVGTQYRSALFWTTAEQRDWIEKTRDAYERELQTLGLGPVTTQVAPAAEHPFYFAEDYHQQYLYKVENGLQRGSLYRCHANTGVALPL